jgi:hypothetical protein
MAWILFGAAAFLLLDIDRQTMARRQASESFDARAHEVTAALADVRVAQQASVMDGQNAAIWKPRVDALVAAARAGIERLAASTTSPAALAALADARDEMPRLVSVDESARAHLADGQRAMASELVLTEGGRAAVTAARLVDRARTDERAEAAREEETARRQQAFVLFGAAVLGGFVVLLLVLAPGPAVEDVESEAHGEDAGRLLRDIRPDPVPLQEPAAATADPTLEAASAICMAVGTASAPQDLAAALARAAALMRASGLIVWLGDGAGGPLEPAVSHGYAPESLARMPVIPRGADNAVAAAYRTGVFQVVASHAADETPAIVAPLVSPAGCIGALTAELSAGEETRPRTRALATLFAAQFASVLGSSAAAAPAGAGPGETAASA